MKILFWVPYPTDGASNRYRVEQYLPYLKKNSIKYYLHPFWTSYAYKILYKNGEYSKKLIFFILGTLYRIFDLITISRYDIIFIHREAYPIGGVLFEKILSVLKKPIIFDFDDAIFLASSSPPNSFIGRFKKPEKVASTIKMCKHVIAGNRYLSDFALRYNASVSIIPTPVDTNKFCPSEKQQSNGIVVGWMGTVTTQEFLEIVKNAFIRLSKKNSCIKFKVVGGDFFVYGLSNLTSKPWSLKDEIEDLRSFDVGIMPMPDNVWTKGKCGFKALLYMSMGIPCVCSPVGVNKEIIVDGVNGFFANSEDEWVEKISRLIEEPDLRYKIGLAGIKTVEEKYSVSVNAPKYLEIIRKVYEENYENKIEGN
jgi:glycosyltransferase involved in cell wall biosynthesis